MDLLMTIIFTGSIWWFCSWLRNGMGDNVNIISAFAMMMQGCMLLLWFLFFWNGMVF